jgi:hypothetical protein
MLFCACLMFSFSAHAFDLNGAWATNEENCGKIFLKKTTGLPCLEIRMLLAPAS